MEYRFRRWKRKASQVCALILAVAVFAASENLSRAFAAENGQGIAGPQVQAAGGVSGNGAKDQAGGVSGGDGFPEALSVSGNLLRSAVSGLTLLEDYKLFRLEGGGRDQVQNGSGEITSVDDLIVRYELVQLFVNSAVNPDSCNVVSGGVYTFPVPAGLLVTNTSQWEVQVNIGGNPTRFGEAVYENGGIKLTLDNADIFNGSVDLVNDAYVEFTCKLDAAHFNDGQEEQRLDFGFGSLPDFVFTYGDNKKTDSRVAKSGVYDPSSRRTRWTVTVTEGSRVYDGGVRLLDTLSKNQDYCQGTFTLDGTPLADSALDIAGNAAGETVLSYAYAPAGVEGEEQVFTYESEFNNGVYVQGDKLAGSVTLEGTNRAELINTADSSVISSDTAAAGSGSSVNLSWLQKTGSTVVIAGDVQETTWTVTVDTNGFAFDHLTLIDQLSCKPANSGTDLAADKRSVFSVVTDSLQVKKDGGPFASVGMSAAGGAASARITKGNDDGTAAGDGGFKWELVLGDTGASGVYTITYKTRITNYSEYRKYNQPKIKNTADVSFDWPDFDGPGTSKHLGMPGVTREEGLAGQKAMLEKEAGVYDKASHEISWHVIVNSEGAAQPDGVYLVETLNGLASERRGTDLDQAYVEIRNLKVGGADAAPEQAAKLTAVLDPDGGEVKIEFGSGSLLNGNKVEFDFITRLTDADYYESNTAGARRCLNSVTMYDADGTRLSSVSASAFPKNTVITKKAGNYDYAAHSVVWTVEVNADAMQLSGAAVEDTITAGELDVDSIRIDGAPVAAPYGVSYTPDGHLTVTLGDIGSKKTVTYTTVLTGGSRITDGGVSKSLAEYNGTIALENRASLRKSSSASEPEADCRTTLNNKLLHKTVEDSGEKNVARFQIYLNQSRFLDMSGRQLTDLMSPGLNLNLASVQLYEARVGADGKFTKEAGPVPKASYTRQVTLLESGNADGAAAGSTKFVLTLPADAGNRAYVLTYLASVDESVTAERYTNAVMSAGIDSDGTGDGVSVTKAVLAGYGGGHATQSSRVKLKLQNASGMALSGAGFVLKYEGQAIASGRSGADGSCIFSNLVPGEEYELELTSAPDGYEAGDGAAMSRRFQALNKGDITYLNNPLLFELDREPFLAGSLGEGDQPLQGVLFGLFAEGETIFTEETALETAVTGSDGNAVFTRTEPGIYQIAQLKVPGGYVRNKTVLAAELDGNGAVKRIYEKEDPGCTPRKDIVNRKTMPVRFYSRDLSGRPIAGAVYGIYAQGADPASDAPLARAVSAADGAVVFEGLPVGTYLIAQMEVPEGYVGNPAVLETAIGEDGTAGSIYDRDDPAKTPVEEVENAEMEFIRLKKTDEEGSPLPGAVFGLYEETGSLNGEPLERAQSGSDGAVRFLTRAPGSYRIAELVAPEGYERSGGLLSARLGEDGTVTYRSQGIALPAGEIPAVTNKKLPPEELPDGGDSGQNPNEPDNGGQGGEEVPDDGSGTGGDNGSDGGNTEEDPGMDGSDSGENDGIGEEEKPGAEEASAEEAVLRASLLPETGEKPWTLFCAGGLLLIGGGLILYGLDAKRRKKDENE